VSWFSDAELARCEAYHGPIARVRHAAAVAELLVIVGAAVFAPAPSVGEPVAVAAARTGVTVALAGLGPRLAAALWRELRHEPARGLVPMPAARPPVPVAAMVVVLDQLIQAVWRAVVVAIGVLGVAWWSAQSAAVASAVVPAVVPAMGYLLGAVARGWRLRFDRAVPIAPGSLPLPLAALVARVPAAASVQWYRGGAPTAWRAEGGYTLGDGRRAAVVLSPEVLAGPVALVEAVAAHELGHVRSVAEGHTGKYAQLVRLGRMVAVVAGFAATGAVLRVWCDGRPPGLWAVAAALPVAAAGAAAAAAAGRRSEAAADRWSVATLADRRGAAQATRSLLLQAGVDLEPRGLRRWFVTYPSASWRLSLLSGEASPAGAGGGRGPDRTARSTPC